MDNKKKGILNIVSNVLNQLVTIVLGLVLTRLVLVGLGSETNGLLTTINQALAYVVLLEAGVGAVSLQSLYKPSAENDHDSINGILSATNRFYKRTGIIYFVVVCLLSIVFPFVIDTSLSKVTVAVVMFLSGLPGVMNYYFHAKYRILLNAEGKNYINTNISTLVHIGTNIAKILLLLAGFDVIMVQAMYFLFSIIQMLCYAIYIKKKYKWINLKVVPNTSAISQSKNALVHQIGGLVFNNTDSLVLTFFCGLKNVSIYATYTLFFSMIQTVVNHFSGVTFILGQSFNTDRKRFMKLHDAYEVFNINLTFSLFCVANLFILPFLKLYTAGVNDINYIDKILPFLFTSVYLLSCGRVSSSMVISYAKHYKETQWRCILESVINVVISVIAVNFIGIYGVLVGTIVALLYRANDMIIYANHKILNRNPFITYRRWILDIVLFIILSLVGQTILSQINLDNYFIIFLCAAIACIAIIPIFFGVTLCFERDVAKTAWTYLKPILIKKK